MSEFEDFESQIKYELYQYENKHRSYAKAILVSCSIYKYFQMYRVTNECDRDFEDEIYIDSTLVLPYDKLNHDEYELIGREICDECTTTKQYDRIEEMKEEYLQLHKQYWNDKYEK